MSELPHQMPPFPPEPSSPQDDSTQDRSMNDDAPEDDPQQSKIEELMDRWEATYDAGDPISVETLCTEQPELIPEIQDRVAALQAVDRKLARRKSKSKAKSKSSMSDLSFDSMISNMDFLNAGGLGEVFVGEDGNLHRRVAVKFMHKKLCEREERRNQFAMEAEITGRLEHPGIVPLYGFGCTEDNRLFYSMRYIEGSTLDQAIKKYYRSFEALDDSKTETSETSGGYDKGQVSFRRLLGYFISVCKTIAYAHNRGVVHRDIKPSNIMIGKFGETIVVDWGLAILVSRDERFRDSGEETLALSPGGSHGGSDSGRGAGTPAYMSPEQFSGLSPTPASDIYSLGATLFVLLCGKPPIRSKTLSEIRNDRIEGKLPDLSEIRGSVPRPLQAIAYKAMAKEPSERYGTALELARDLERYLADEPVTAYQDSLGMRLGRLARRHRRATQATALGLITCLLIAGVSAVWITLQHRQSESLRTHNLASSSQFMARSIGQDIDRIWRVLEFEAESPELRRLVQESNQRIAAAAEQGETEAVTVETQSELQAWLEKRMLEYEHLNTVNAMFVLSQDATQLARAPMPEQPQIGENFGYRDYYTGLGYDLQKGTRSVLSEPLTGPRVAAGDAHMSVVYLSTLQDEPVLKVTYTTTIWDKPHEHRLGVIGTSVSIGQVFDAQDGKDVPLWLTQLKQSAWLVDLRDDYLDNGMRSRGLLLQHPSLQSQDLSSEVPRISSSLIDRIEKELKQTMDAQAQPSVWEIPDPIHKTPVFGSVVPITIDGRGEKPLDLHWVVVTAEAAVE